MRRVSLILLFSLFSLTLDIWDANPIIFRRIKQKIYPSIVINGYKLEYAGEYQKFGEGFPSPDGGQYLEDRLGGRMLGIYLMEFLERENVSTENIILEEGKSLKEATDLIQEINEKEQKGERLNAKEIQQRETLIVEINKLITERAFEEVNKDNKPFTKFIEKIGLEFGHALGYYMLNIRERLLDSGVPQDKVENVISNVVLVGGVIEHLGIRKSGNGVQILKNKKSEDLLLAKIKEGINQVLSNEGLSFNVNVKRTNAVENEDLGAKRDFYAFPPEKGYVNIALRLHGTSFSCGIVRDTDGLKAEIVKELRWREELSDQLVGKTKEEKREVLIGKMAEMLGNALKKVSDKGYELGEVCISWAGPGKYWVGWVSAPNIDGFEEEVDLKSELCEKVKGIENKIEIYHDGIAAALGETNPKGTFGNLEEKSLLAIIWGTGIGAGILIDGKAYYNWKNGKLRELGPLGEIGHHIIFRRSP